jgi:hypothetical protein
MRVVLLLILCAALFAASVQARSMVLGTMTISMAAQGAPEYGASHYQYNLQPNTTWETGLLALLESYNRPNINVVNFASGNDPVLTNCNWYVDGVEHWQSPARTSDAYWVGAFGIGFENFDYCLSTAGVFVPSGKPVTMNQTCKKCTSKQVLQNSGLGVWVVGPAPVTVNAACVGENCISSMTVNPGAPNSNQNIIGQNGLQAPLLSVMLTNPDAYGCNVTFTNTSANIVASIVAGVDYNHNVCVGGVAVTSLAENVKYELVGNCPKCPENYFS